MRACHLVRFARHVVGTGLCGAGLLLGCATAPVTDAEVLTRLQAAPKGSHLSGTVTGVGAPEIINRRDFVYALDFDDESKRLAFIHHVSTSMELTLTGLAPLAPVFQEKINKSEFDCEDVVIDGDRVLVPSRQGVLRALDAANGKLIAELTTGEPLLRVAVGVDHIFVGSSEGRVLIFDRQLGFVGEAKIHDDEVRGLAVLADGRVATASVDGTFKISKVAPVDAPLVRLPTSTLATGEQVFLAHLDGKKAIATIRDARQPFSLVSRAAVKRLELASSPTAETLAVPTAEGVQQLPSLALGELRLRALSVGNVTAAVCDACLPPGVELLLGQDVLSTVTVAEDIAAGDLVVRPVEGAARVAMIPGARSLVVDKAMTLPGPANDVDVSDVGTVIVTFSNERAERSFDINDAERKGKTMPASPASGAVVVDVATMLVTKSLVNEHLGFAVSGALSPDGKTAVTGGWDKRFIVWDVATGTVVTERSLAWALRRVRISPDGRMVGVAGWTPVNALNEGDSDPSMVLYPLVLASPTIVSP